MDGGTSRYGLDESSTRAAATAASAVIRTFVGLISHHELARAAAREAFADFDDAMALHDRTSDITDRLPIQRPYLDVLRARIDHFADARARLISALEPLRGPSSDLIVEAQVLFAGATVNVDVEAPAPQNVLDIPVPPLSAVEQIRLADETYSWSRQESYPLALLAGKACYTLSQVIKPTTPTAIDFVARCAGAERDADSLIESVFAPLD